MNKLICVILLLLVTILSYCEDLNYNNVIKNSYLLCDVRGYPSDAYLENDMYPNDELRKYDKSEPFNIKDFFCTGIYCIIFLFILMCIVGICSYIGEKINKKNEDKKKEKMNKQIDNLIEKFEELGKEKELLYDCNKIEKITKDRLDILKQIVNIYNKDLFYKIEITSLIYYDPNEFDKYV